LRPDLNKKPLRNISPTYVIVRPVSELPKGKRIYYSETFFSPINKNGTISTQIISAVDNTGFRSYCGNELFIFDNEQECIEEWNRQLSECQERINIKMSNILNDLRVEFNNLDKMKR
jgi:hypothetical protein